jgi:exopolyphosphatase / guanosine-5'-triphosphate,3'-diphosphate pyrophosphatase
VTRVAVVDMGTNSTRLLVADVGDGTVTAIERRSIVTRLGEGLEQTGALGDEPQARVLRALDEYRRIIDACAAEIRTGVLTSAVRDASNGQAFHDRVRAEYGIDAEVISGDEEARLTFLGATLGRSPDDRVLVVDIGGGSTELVVGAAGRVEFHDSTQVGVVRHTERHGEDVDALRADARATLRAAFPDGPPTRVVAVAGTATMAASMDLELEPYDPEAVEGHVLSLDALRDRLTQLAALPVQERRDVPGLHPDRAPTIVAGIAILIEVLEAAGAQEVEVSDRDLLYGRALAAAGS